MCVHAFVQICGAKGWIEHYKSLTYTSVDEKTVWFHDRSPSYMAVLVIRVCQLIMAGLINSKLPHKSFWAHNKKKSRAMSLEKFSNKHNR